MDDAARPLTFLKKFPLFCDTLSVCWHGGLQAPSHVVNN